MKWSKVGKQKYEAVSVIGTTYVVSKVSIYLWSLTADGIHVAVCPTARPLKDRAARHDVERQKQILK